MIIDISTKIGTTSNQGGFKGLLDVYSGAAAAYSLRKLSKATTSVVRVRRDSDNAEADFTALEITDGTLEAFCTGTDGLVTTWYDQSGNGNDATNGSASEQPKIVSAGVLLKDNGEPIVDGLDASLSFSLVGSSNTWIFSTIKITTDNVAILYSNGGTPPYWGYGNSLSTSAISSGLTGESYYINGIVRTGLTRVDLFNFTQSQALFVGSADDSGITASTLGYNSGSIDMYQMKEFVIYHSDQSTNRSGIEANINKAFNIYWDGTQKGLLDTYTGAEAAYSLRALNSAYTGAILKVRRDSDNAEQDIYAKWDGTLNVEALETFCAATDGYVVTWYDQAGSNNATQATAASQPKIVSGGSVILENGKAAVEFNLNFLLTPSVSFDFQNSSLFYIARRLIFGSAWDGYFSGVPRNILTYRRFSNSLTNVNINFNQSFQYSSIAWANGLQHLFSITSDPSTTIVRENGITQASAASVAGNYSNVIYLGKTDAPAEYSYITTQELIIYPSDQSTNRIGIEANINNYYNIY